jgi:hypothetical protein
MIEAISQNLPPTGGSGPAFPRAFDALERHRDTDAL